MEWKTITDYPNYQISNCGLIKNKKENFLKSRDNNHGYEIVNLFKTSSVYYDFLESGIKIIESY